MRNAWLLLIALMLSACGDPREAHMRSSLEHAQTELHRAQFEPLAAARLRNAMETGSLIDYLNASVPEGSSYGPFRWQNASQPFDVVVSGSNDDWTLDGYGEQLDAPIVSVHVVRQ